MYYIEQKEILLIDPREFGLSIRAMIGKYYDNYLVLIKDRKSRIIMKDGNQILDQINLIQNNKPNIKISLATNAPVCRKTATFFMEKGIEILTLQKHQ